MIVARLKEKEADLAATELSPWIPQPVPAKRFLTCWAFLPSLTTNLRERQAEGIASAKARGGLLRTAAEDRSSSHAGVLLRATRPPTVPREMGISRGTVYKAKAKTHHE